MCLHGGQGPLKSSDQAGQHPRADAEARLATGLPRGGIGSIPGTAAGAKVLFDPASCSPPVPAYLHGLELATDGGVLQGQGVCSIVAAAGALPGLRECLQGFAAQLPRPMIPSIASRLRPSLRIRFLVRFLVCSMHLAPGWLFAVGLAIYPIIIRPWGCPCTLPNLGRPQSFSCLPAYLGLLALDC